MASVPDRVCVLVNHQSFEAFEGACKSKSHGHMSGPRAAALESNDQAEWLHETVVSRKGKESKRRRPAIRLVKAKRWKGVPSGVRTLKVMQLVAI